VAQIYGISRTTLTSWIKYVKELKFEKLEAPKERKKKNILSEVHRERIKGWIESNPNITINEVRIKIDEAFGIEASKSTIHRAMLGLNF